MKKYTLLRLTGLAVFIMFVLIIISFFEVPVFANQINPGQDEHVYKAHASYTAPFISGIFGFIIFFLITRYWANREMKDVAQLVFLFPLIYLLTDIIIVTAI